MNFFNECDDFYFEIGYLILFALGYLFIKRKKDLKITLQYFLYAYGIGILLLSFKIPYIFSGFPDELSDLENKSRLLYHLQKNNEALVQTTETIRNMTLLTFVFISIIIGKVIKYCKIENSTE